MNETETADRDVIYIEYCNNCKDHQWCTNHKQPKYTSYFNQCISLCSISQNRSLIFILVKGALLVSVKNVIVAENSHPNMMESFNPWKGTTDFKSKLLALHSLVIDHRGKVAPYPRIGAFEVYFQEKVK